MRASTSASYRGRLLAAVALAVTVAGARVTAAAPEDPTKLSAAERTRRSRALYELGRSQFNVADYDAALKSFTAAYEYRPLPLFLYNLGQVALAAGDGDKALRFFERYLVEEPAAPEAAEVRREIGKLRARTVAKPPAPVATSQAPTPPPPSTTPAAPPPAALSAPVAQARPALDLVAPAAPRRHRLRAGAWAAIGVGSALVVAGIAIAVGLTVGREGAPSSSWGDHPAFR